jgi:6-phosphofructokinase 1
MATILRKPGKEYMSYFDKVALELVANSARQIPSHWITDDQLDVTDDFIEYARPLIGDGWPEIVIEHGLQRFARFNIQFIDKKLPDYLPVRFRETGGS